MIDVRDQEQEKLWDSIITLANIDKEQAKVVFKAVVERSLRRVDMYTPFVASIPLRLPDYDHVQLLKGLEKQINNHFTLNEEEKAYELLVEYIEVVSELTEKDSKFIRRRLIASILRHRRHQTPFVQDPPTGYKPTLTTITTSSGEEERVYYTPNELAKRLGVSDQTVRRMCERGKFPGAYKTDGGHWKIPKDVMITTQEQDQKADKLLQKIDIKNIEVGDVDEFDL